MGPSSDLLVSSDKGSDPAVCVYLIMEMEPGSETGRMDRICITRVRKIDAWMLIVYFTGRVHHRV